MHFYNISKPSQGTVLFLIVTYVFKYWAGVSTPIADREQYLLNGFYCETSHSENIYCFVIGFASICTVRLQRKMVHLRKQQGQRKHCLQECMGVRARSLYAYIKDELTSACQVERPAFSKEIYFPNELS